MQGSKAVLCLSIIEAFDLASKVKIPNSECYIRLGCVIISTPYCKLFIMPANGSIRHEWNEDHCTDRLAIYAGDYFRSEKRFELSLDSGITTDELIKELRTIIKTFSSKRAFTLTRRARELLTVAGL